MKLEDKKYRVRFFTHVDSNLDEFIDTDRNSIFWRVGRKFAKTPQYDWVERNKINLQWHLDDIYTAFGKAVTFYADLKEIEYIDYTLRFFEFDEEWK